MTARHRGSGSGLLATPPVLLVSWSPAARAEEPAVHYNLGLQLKRENKNAEAIAELEKAIKMRPDYAAAHFTLGNIWRVQGDYARAAAELEQAVKLQPREASAHANLGAI